MVSKTDWASRLDKWGPPSSGTRVQTSLCCPTRRVTMPHSEALFEKSCLRCHPTHSYHRMGSSGIEQLFNPPREDRIPVCICQRVHHMFCDPALGVEGWERDLVQMLPVDAMALWPQDIHAMAEGLLFDEGLFVLLVPDVLLHDILFYTLRLLGVFYRQSQGLSTSLGAGQHTVRLLARRTRLSTFPESSCWPNCTEGGPGGSQTCRRGLVLGHVLVHILGFEVKEKAITVRVEELAALSVLRFELVVIEVVHQVLGEIQNAHAHIHRAIEH